MKKIVLGLTLAAATLTAGVAMAQPYGYYRDDRGGYDYRYARDSDRDGIPDRREWNRDRDRDGRPDQYDRYDNRRDRHHGRHHRDGRWSDSYRYDYRYYR